MTPRLHAPWGRGGLRVEGEAGGEGEGGVINAPLRPNVVDCLLPLEPGLNEGDGDEHGRAVRERRAARMRERRR